MKKGIFLLWCITLFGCSGDESAANKRYVLSIALEGAGGGRSAGPNMEEQIDVDTVTAPSPLEAYSKGVQRYAALLMHIQQFPDSIKAVKELNVRDEQGNDIKQSISQKQRDSVIMNFIQFARRSTIPYYERVKDFELKLMTAR
ncbi:hypothetical protein ACFOET_19080 [Parapedobacter deserti]|uniref:Lipoprotein n=1 Tax=Parapedobacter deserti TaxID=1912957 RepID=A0ABV7JNP7_9SPHI